MRYFEILIFLTFLRSLHYDLLLTIPLRQYTLALYCLKNIKNRQLNILSVPPTHHERYFKLYILFLTMIVKRPTFHKVADQL